MAGCSTGAGSAAGCSAGAASTVGSATTSGALAASTWGTGSAAGAPMTSCSSPSRGPTVTLSAAGSPQSPCARAVGTIDIWVHTMTSDMRTASILLTFWDGSNNLRSGFMRPHLPRLDGAESVGLQAALGARIPRGAHSKHARYALVLLILYSDGVHEINPHCKDDLLCRKNDYPT